LKNRWVKQANKTVKTKFKLMRFNLDSKDGIDKPELSVEYNNIKDVHERVVRDIDADGVWILVSTK